MVDNENDIELLIWMNGKTKEFSFRYKIENISHLSLTAARLKFLLSQYIFDNKKIYNLLNLPKNAEIIQHLYTKNEAELEDYDIPHLKNNDVLFFSFDLLGVYKSSNNFYQYEFIKSIKSGGFGKVFLAREVTSNKEYAIKEISTQNYSNEILYNMSREYMILKEMTHKNIIKFHTFFTYNNNFYIVMDYARGGELSYLLEDKKKLSEDEAKNIFRQIFNAVCYMHRKNIIHRDLKPNNILFLDEEKTHIVIIDFGISGIANGNQREQIKAGTVKFLPPETLSGREFSSDTRLDMWALGIILFRMVEGYYPFEGKTYKETINNIFRNKLEFNSKIKISPPLKQLIEGLLEKNYRFRIDSDSPLFAKWFEHKIILNSHAKKKVKKSESSDEDLYNIDYVNRYSNLESYNQLYEDENEKQLLQSLAKQAVSGYLSQTKSTSMKCKPKIFYIKNDYSYMKKNSLPYKIELSRSLKKKKNEKKNSIDDVENIENEKNNNTNNKLILPKIINNNNNSNISSNNLLENNLDLNIGQKLFLRNIKNKRSSIYQNNKLIFGHNYNILNIKNNHHNTNYLIKSNDNISIHNDLHKDFNILTSKYNNSNLKFGIKPYKSNDFINNINNNNNGECFRIKNNFIAQK